MHEFCYPILLVEPEFTDLLEEHKELGNALNDKVEFIVDSQFNYYDADGKQIEARFAQLVSALKHTLSHEGHCCSAKMQLTNEAQVFAAMKEMIG
ncbi:hypothetical protein V1358_07810 [Pseudoalteromonas sp. YIC-656]|uniref:hypothetical protein n=1 Tax=Pseudoalteromonas pernae TaxID=3118054 RepID=UPI0032420B80